MQTLAGTVNVGLLRTFLAAYRSRSMTRTADELDLSQPGVTAHIKNLEKQLGAQLFVRTSRGLVPTTAADELAARTGPHLDALLAALGDVVSQGSAQSPYDRTVLLGGPAELVALRVLPALGDLYSHGLRLRITTGLADDLLSELASGGLDLVVSTVRPRGRGLTAVPLADEDFVLVAPPSLAQRLDLTRLPADARTVLGDTPVVAYSEELPIVRRYWRHVFGRRPPAGIPAVLAPDLRAVAAATTSGAGYTVLPRYLGRDHLADGRLVLLHEPDDPPINTFHLAWRTSAADHPAVAAVRTRLRTTAAHW
jgi:DNA-binding transcriptional LysR family regulator